MLNRTCLLVLVAALAACRGDGVCRNDKCDAAVPVAVVDDAGKGGALGAGAYRFIITTGYAETEWSCTLPGGDCDHDFFTDFEDGEDDGTLSVQARLGETGLAVKVLETRANIWSGPEEFAVQVERDGVMLADDSFMPRYRNLGPSDACAVCLTREGASPVVHLPAE
jgi:hypothetical protein